MSRRLLAASSAIVLAAGVTACSVQPAPLPPPRASIPAGHAYAPFKAYLAAHPQPHRRGMTYGVLVQSHSHGYVCVGYCHTWQGTAVVPGGRIEHLASDQGDNGMAALVSPGDLVAFPAGGPVDAPADDGGTLAVRVIIAGAVKP